jgi:PQQ-dependent dehydrogenase (s-GDH family)
MCRTGSCFETVERQQRPGIAWHQFFACAIINAAPEQCRSNFPPVFIKTKIMKHRIFHAVTAFLLLFSCNAFAQSTPFAMRQLACNLSQPWEIKFGPDSWLWVTEAQSYKLDRVNPSTGATELLLDLSAKKNFPNAYAAQTFPQGGLQGFAFHPDFANNPYIYLAYVHRFDSCKTGTGGCFFRTKLVRYNYDIATKAFSNETVITDTIPGSTDHNGGRLVIGPGSGTTNSLFYSVGDMGAGHLGNGSRAHHGQLTNVWEGKILRFNLTSDGDSGPDAWIPNDNPFSTAGYQNAVWSLGHRNPQGLVFGPTGILYESEHGPYSDDEINIVKRANNYGFPLIMGFADGNYDGSKAGAGSGLPMVTSEAASKTAIEANYTYSEPIFSLFRATKAEVTTMWTNDVNNTPPYASYYLQYPTSAPSGIDYYNSTAIPGWQGSLLVTNLKLGNVYRLKLSADGSSVTSDTMALFTGLGRFRDLAISPDGTKIYASTDTGGAIKGAPGASVTPPNRGCILEFSFVPTRVTGVARGATMLVSPNPANGQFSVSLPAGTTRGELRVTDLLGKQVYNSTLSQAETRFDSKAFVPGVYNLQVIANGETRNERVVIQ